ncbi:hypothetical protein H5410_062049 [Solanum commersonii]|uniref:Uncharacterized protein n=1 Tax=Solanum commersonii TaxID=4109 RepID=A0A9J5W9C2_SOLCO|nr:hypothetical protein H5410_062049 [Solanum commersonii]
MSIVNDFTEYMCLVRALLQQPFDSKSGEAVAMLKEIEDNLLINEGRIIKLSQPKLSLCFLIGIYAESFDDYQWIIEHKEVANFKVRRHFTTRMLEEARGGNKEESYEMLINKSELLEVSFEYTIVKDPTLLLGDLLLQFEHEEATGLEC